MYLIDAMIVLLLLNKYEKTLQAEIILYYIDIVGALTKQEVTSMEICYWWPA